MAFVEQFRRDVVDAATWLRSGQGSPVPFEGLSPEAAHRRLMHRAGADDESEADYELRSRFRALSWGPTTDSVTAYLFRDKDRLALTVQFRRGEHLIEHPEGAGEVFVVDIPTAEFIGILEELVAVLDGGRGPGFP